MKRSLSARFLALALVVCFVAAETFAVTAGPELPNPGSVSGVTKEQQEQLGLKAMAEVYKQMPVLPDSSPVSQYVQRLGKKLATVVPSQYSWPYQFHVVEQKDINAFALPGGPIFVNVGTITAADNEAELAGVIAHEMSHVYMQHSIKQMVKAQRAEGLAGLLGALAGAVGGTVGTLARAGIQIGGGLVMMKYSRGDEAQADEVGAIIMYKAGYNPRAMAEFFQKLEQQGGSGPQFLSDHPNPGNRVQAVDNEIRNWPRKNYSASTGQFQQAKQQAQNIKAYTAQQIQQGAQSGQWARQNQQNHAIPANVPMSDNTSGGQPGASGASLENVTYSQIKPSGSFSQLPQNDAIAMQYPSNWQAASDPNGGGITIAPPAGVSQGAVAYGVVINGGNPPNATSLDDATQAIVQGLKQSNPDLQPMGSPQKITVNGVQGRSLDMIGRSPIQQNGQPARERDWLVALPRPGGGLVYMIFIAPDSQFSQLRPTYERMLKSVRLQ